MKKLLLSVFILVVVVIAAGAVYFTTKPSPFNTNNPLIASSGPIELLKDFNHDPLTEGWGHRKFLTVKPATMDFLKILCCRRRADIHQPVKT